MMSDDLIKRSDAIKAFCNDCRNIDAPCEHEKTCKSMRVLRRIPSADRPQGEWIDNTSETWTPSKKCSECGLVVHSVATDSTDFHAKTKMNFCPNCGARMRPKLQGKHFDSIIIDECAMKGADDDSYYKHD